MASPNMIFDNYVDMIIYLCKEFNIGQIIDYTDEYTELISDKKLNNILYYICTKLDEIDNLPPNKIIVGLEIFRGYSVDLIIYRKKFSNEKLKNSKSQFLLIEEIYFNGETNGGDLKIYQVGEKKFFFIENFYYK